MRILREAAVAGAAKANACFWLTRTPHARAVIEAKDLKAGDWKPYVKLAFEKQKVKTPAAESASAPQWNAEFKFDVTMSLDAAELRLEVADKQDTKEFLGHLKIRLDSLPAHREHDQWFKLVPKVRASCVHARARTHKLIGLALLAPRARAQQWRDKVTGSIRLVVLLEPHASLAKRLSIADFDLMTVLGKGSFGKVMLVRKKDTSRIYAMKVLSKVRTTNETVFVHARALFLASPAWASRAHALAPGVLVVLLFLFLFLA